MSDRDSGNSPTARRVRRSRSNTRSRSRSPRRGGKIHTKRVIIANVPYDVNWQKLKEIFREKVGYTGYVEMVEVNGKALGMGIMQFRTYEGAEKAIEVMHRYPLGDRKLVVREETARDQERIAQYKSGVDPEQAQQAMNSVVPQMLNQLGIEGPATNSIYISNLDYKVTWQKLKDVFRMAGHVLNVDIKVDKEGRSRGFAVVKFDQPFEAVQAISMFNGQSLFDRPMRIKIDREGQAGGGPGNGMGGRMGNGGGARNGPSIPGRMGGGPGLLPGGGGPMGGGGGRLPEGLKSVGMGLGMGGNTLRNVQDLAMSSQNMSMGGGPNMGPMGGMNGSGGGAMGMGGSGNNAPVNANAALLGLQQLLAAAAAGGMNQDQLLSAASSIGQGVLGAVSGGMEMSNGSGNMGNMRGGGGRQGMDSNRGGFRGGMSGPDMMMGGGGRNMNNMSGGRVPKPDCVVVRNLPFSYTWQDLKRSFHEVGEVRSAEIRMDDNNRSKGYGYVHFFNPADAMRAVDIMSGARFDGRSIRVEMDK